MKLQLEKSTLLISFEGWEKIWALKNRLEIPLSSIVNITTVVPVSHWSDLRCPGTFLPGVIKAGSYYTRSGWQFWYVTRKQGKNILCIELSKMNFHFIVLSFSDAALWKQKLDSARKKKE